MRLWLLNRLAGKKYIIALREPALVILGNDITTGTNLCLDNATGAWSGDD